MDKFETFEEAEEHGFKFVEITLEYATTWQAYLPGVAFLGNHPTKNEALENCSSYYKFFQKGLDKSEMNL